MENKTNQSGAQNRNRSRNRNRNRNSGRGPHRDRNRNSNQGSGGARKYKSRSRKPKVIELTLFQKILKAITFGAVDPNKKNAKPARSQTKTAQPNASSSRPEKSGDSSRSATQRKSRDPKVYEVTNARLYVGNLDYEAQESDLEDLFKGVGNVLSAEVVTNSRTQQSKGFAFVEMGSIEEAKRAVEVLHDQDFMGRKLLVSGAKSEGPRGQDDDDSAEAA